MVKRLRIRYTVTASAILLIVLIVIGVAINLFNYYNFIASTNKTMSIIAANNGEFPDYEEYLKMLEAEESKNQIVPSVVPAGDETTDLPSGTEDTAPDESPADVEILPDQAETYAGLTTDGTDSGTAETGDPDELAEESAILEKFEYSPGFGFGLKVTAETAYETRYFTVRFDPDSSTMIANDLSHIVEVSKKEALSLGKAVLNSDKNTGVYGNYRYYTHETKDGVTEIIFLNCANQIRSVKFVLYISLFTLVAVLALVTVAVWFMSKRIVKPFSDNLEKQKQFITDAGHEIKTPLAIIDANAEVLKLTSGDNEWIDSIQNQTSRLSALIKKLVSLSKNEEGFADVSFEEFDLSEAAADAVSPFEVLSEKNGVSLETDIEPGIAYKGSESSIRQLFGILLDNAIKYTPEGGSIKVSLKDTGKPVFEIYNDCDELDTSKIPHYFDRFYRADDSRSRETGGYGIGLSIAKAIVDNHKGRIFASSGDGKSITFTVTL